MSIVGANLFLMACRLIARQEVPYYKFLSRSINSIGLDEAVYSPPVTLLAGVQPVPRNVYQQLGLDFQKSYVMVYFSDDVVDIARDTSGDQIAFQGRQYQCLSNDDWYGLDGWKGTLCVDIGEQTPYYQTIGFEGDGFVNFDNGNFGYVAPVPFPETFKSFGFAEGDWGFEFGNFGHE